MNSAKYKWPSLADASLTLSMQHARPEPREDSHALIAIAMLLVAFALWLWVF